MEVERDDSDASSSSADSVPQPELGRQELQITFVSERSGPVHVEVMNGGYMSRVRMVVALPSAAAVAEVRSLETGGAAHVDLDALLYDLGLVVQYAEDCVGSGSSALHARQVGGEDRARLGGTARRLLVFALQRGWGAVTALVLPVVSADCEGGSPGHTAAELALAKAGSASPNGLSLLHLAVGSRSAAAVRALLEWGVQEGVRVSALTPAGASRLTPLHVAAVVPDGGELARVLTGEKRLHLGRIH